MDRKSKVNRTRKNRNGYLAFHKGELISDHVLANIIGAARRGLMTEAGAKLLLIPDTRSGEPDVSGLRHIGPFRKCDCKTLKQLIREERTKSRLHNTGKKRPKKDNKISDIKIAKTGSDSGVSETDISHKTKNKDVA